MWLEVTFLCVKVAFVVLILPFKRCAYIPSFSHYIIKGNGSADLFHRGFARFTVSALQYLREEEWGAVFAEDLKTVFLRANFTNNFFLL